MALADGKATFKTNVKNTLKSLAANEDKDLTLDEALDLWVDSFVDHMETWIKDNASVSVPGTGLEDSLEGDVTGTASGTIE